MTRTGYLIDALALDFDLLLKKLRTVRCACARCVPLAKATDQRDSSFNKILHLRDPASDQSFFINVPLFRSQDNLWNTTFVSTASLQAIPPPPPLIKTWGCLRNSLNEDIAVTTLNLTERLPTSVTVPLAALLLEYPVAYVPGPIGDVAHVSLEVYKCTAVIGTSEVDVIKFSCPHGIEGLSVDMEVILGCYRARGVIPHIRKSVEVVGKLVL